MSCSCWIEVPAYSSLREEGTLDVLVLVVVPLHRPLQISSNLAAVPFYHKFDPWRPKLTPIAALTRQQQGGKRQERYFKTKW